MNKKVGVVVAVVLALSVLAGPVAAGYTTTPPDGGAGTTTAEPTVAPTTPEPTPTPTPTAEPAAGPTQPPTQTPTESAGGQNTTTPTATPTTEPRETVSPGEKIERIRSGEYSLEELNEPGVSPAGDDRESMRYLGSPVEGFALLNYQDITVMDLVMGNDPSWNDIGDDTRVEQNEVRLQAAAWGSMQGEYSLHTVYYQEEDVTIGNQTYTYAANQTEDRSIVQLGGASETLYTTQNVSLDAHYDEPHKVSMWLTSNGEPVDGARWTFDHLSNPASKSVTVTSSGGLWAFSLRNAIVPGAIAVVIGLALAWVTIRRVGRGPGYGIGSWALLAIIGGTIVSLVATYQIAVVLQNAPWLMGGSLFVVSYAAGLTFHDPVKKIGFFRRELVDANTNGGGRVQKAIKQGGEDAEELFGGDSGAEVFDELTESVFVDLPQVPAVRTDEGYKVPVKGIRPFFARFFASAAILDLGGVATRTKVRIGELDDIIYVDPQSDPTLEHKAATMKRVLPVDTLGDNPSWQEELVAYIISAAIVFVPAIGGGIIFAQQWNIPSVGALLGLVVTVVIAHSAEDGWVEFEEAPHHYKRAEDSLTMLQRAYKSAKEDESGVKAAREERARTALEARDDSQSEKKTVTDKVLDSMGVDEIAMEKTAEDVEVDDEDA